jgi:hypothetical protein
MEAICSSETSVETHQTTRRCILEDYTLHNHRCENLKSYKIKICPQYFLKLPSVRFHKNPIGCYWDVTYGQIHRSSEVNPRVFAAFIAKAPKVHRVLSGGKCSYVNWYTCRHMLWSSPCNVAQWNIGTKLSVATQRFRQNCNCDFL